MERPVTRWLRRLFLWDFPRGSWQYDVIVLAILAFIFVTPRAWFRDQPRIPSAASVFLLPSGRGEGGLWVDAPLLEGVPPEQRVAKLNELLKGRTPSAKVIRVQEVFDEAEQELKGYIAITQ
ncbi:MAG: hypothetical protein IPM24_15125 [Bryobacterales bacterium]|jgi:hypothetical protein|nr:hypothetical protein [Bryobacterales bacterium]